MIRSTLYFSLVLLFLGASSKVFSQKAGNVDKKQLEKDLPGTWNVTRVDLSSFFTTLTDEEKEMYEAFLPQFEEALTNLQMVFFKDKTGYVDDKSVESDGQIIDVWSISTNRNSLLLKMENTTEELDIQNYNSSNQKLKIALFSDGISVGIVLDMEKAKDNKKYAVNNLVEEIKSLGKSMLGTWVFDEKTISIKRDFMSYFNDGDFESEQLIENGVDNTINGLSENAKKQIITFFSDKSYVIRDNYSPYNLRETGKWKASRKNVSLQAEIESFYKDNYVILLNLLICLAPN